MPFKILLARGHDACILHAMDARTLVQELGGPSAVAKELGVASNVVTNWYSKEGIPATYHLPLWRLAARLGVRWRPPNSEGFAPVGDPSKAA